MSEDTICGNCKLFTAKVDRLEGKINRLTQSLNEHQAYIEGVKDVFRGNISWGGDDE